MEPKDVIAVEKKLSEITGRNCYMEYTRYDGIARLEPDKKYNEPDGLVKDKLNIFPGSYHQDYLIKVMSDKAPNDYYSEDRQIAYFRLYQLPGCCGVCVSSGAQTSGRWRKRGINTLLNKFRMDLAKHMGYSVMLCSDIASNIASKKTLQKNGWKDIHQFKNRRSGNTVDISLIDLV